MKSITWLLWGFKEKSYMSEYTYFNKNLYLNTYKRMSLQIKKNKKINHSKDDLDLNGFTSCITFLYIFSFLFDTIPLSFT